MTKNSPSTKSPNRLFRFFLWNDMHIRSPKVSGRPVGYPFVNEKALWALECALGRHGFEQPDFVLSAGDIIDGEIPDYNEDFAFLKEFVLDQLTVPFLPCVGNHENGQGEGISELNLAYDRWFGKEWHNYVFTICGIGFIVVDTSGAHRLPDEVTGQRNAFVKRAFEFLADMPIIVVTHVPLLPMRNEGVLKASFGFESWKVRDGEFLRIVECKSERVIAVLCGHLHLTAVRWNKGIAHICPAGTAGYPADFASFDVYPDRIQMRMHSAPKQWLDIKGNIHGKPRHKVDYTDDEHPDHERYLWGNSYERELTIRLEGGKAPKVSGEKILKVFHELEQGVWHEGR